MDVLIYDPIIDGPATTYRCPGLNFRNTFTNDANVSSCRTITSAVLDFSFSLSRVCRNTTALNYALGNKQCGTFGEATAFETTFRNEKECKVTSIAAITTTATKSHCDIATSDMAYIRGIAVVGIISCKTIVPDANWIGNKRCGNFLRALPSDVYMITSKSCRPTAITFNPIGGKNCNPSITTEGINEFVQIGKACRPVHNIIEYVGAKRCGTFFLTDDIVAGRGLTTNLQLKLCRITSLQEFNPTGQKRCGNYLKTYAPLVLGRVKDNGCADAPAGPLYGQKIKCGGPTAADVPELIFGRVWGGRQARIFGTRTNGRMIGKIKP